MIYTIIPVLVYFTILLFLGFSKGSKATNLESYSLGKRNLGYFSGSASTFATWFGAGVLIGGTASVYKNGVASVMADPIAASFALFFAGFVFAKKLNQSGKLTVADILSDAFGEGIARFASILLIPVYIGWLSALLLAMGYGLSLLFPISTSVAAFLSAGIVASYTQFGGFKSVIKTDKLNLFCILIGMILLIFFIVTSNTFLEVKENLTLNDFNAFQFTGYSLLDYSTFAGKWIVSCFGAAVTQELAQRILSAKTPKIAKQSTITAGFLYIGVGILTIFLGVFANKSGFIVENENNLIYELANNYLPVYLIGFFYISVFAVTLSSADSAVLASAVLFAENVMSKNAKVDKLKLSKVSVPCFCLVSATIGIYFKSVYDLMVYSWATMAISILVPFLAALVFKSTNSQRAKISMITGCSIFLTILMVVQSTTSDSDQAFYTGALLGFMASFLCFVVPGFQIKKLFSVQKK